MQHLVVLEVVQQHDWGALRLASHEHRQSGNARRFAVREVGKQEVDRQHTAAQQILNDLAAAIPRRHQHEDDRMRS